MKLVSLIGRFTCLIFLFVTAIAATRSPVGPLDCLVLQRVAPTGTIVVSCATVNCSANSACDVDFFGGFWFEGYFWVKCFCSGGEPNPHLCEAWFNVGFGVKCIDNGCDPLEPCTRQTAGPAWAPACDCGPIPGPGM